jgi:hypothetical protein
MRAIWNCIREVRAAPRDASGSSRRPEDELLLCCARICLDARHAARLRSLLHSEIDWSYLVPAARRHGLVPLLYSHLHSSAQDAVPAHWLGLLRDYFHENLRRSMYRTGLLIKILTLLDSHGISALPYKGPIAAQLLYGNIALREFNDLDLLVRQEDIPEAHAVLVAHGYAAEFDSRGLPEAGFRSPAAQYAYSDPDGATPVELHTETTLRYFPRPLSPGWLREGTEAVSFAGRRIRVLAPEKMLLTLCVHGAKDFWNQLKWVCDIAEFVRVYSRFDWQQFLREARRMDCARMVLLPLFLARDLLGTTLPPECAEWLGADAVVPELAAQVRRGLFEHSSTFTLPERFLFRARMPGRLSNGIRYTFRLATTPTEEDRALAKLPAALSFAYGLLRPFRLLRKYGVANSARP